MGLGLRGWGLELGVWVLERLRGLGLGAWELGGSGAYSIDFVT